MILELKAFLKKKIPIFFVLLQKISLYKRESTKNRIISKLKKCSSKISVLYITDDFPNRPPLRSEFSSGGRVKMNYLAEIFPHSYPCANIVYTVSSVAYNTSARIIAKAKQKRFKIVVNQNGVAYPAWHGNGWEKTNLVLKETIDQADYIIYQSQFCLTGATRFLMPPNVPSQVIYNPVDTDLFKPVSQSLKPTELTLLLGGNQNEKYRVELALKTLKSLTKKNPNAKLIITGQLWDQEAYQWTRNYLEKNRLVDNVNFIGIYSQEQAPLLFSQAHILLHTQYCDASPTLVLEAMASGLPVVYVNSGGTPELVDNAGIGVYVEQSWEKINLPKPEDMANAVFKIMSQFNEYSCLARERAVENFSLPIFIDKHKRIFENVLDN